MKKIKVLNLYAGLGGNRKKWKNVDVTAIELDEKISKVYQSLYKSDTVIITDAHAYLAENAHKFDFVWSSPKCQSHTVMMKATRHTLNRYPDFKLYEEIVFLQNFFKGKFVVENVKPYYKPLIQPTATIGRHIFWANFPVAAKDIKTPSNFIGLNNTAGAELLKKWLGIKYEGNIYYEGNHSPTQVLRNCVHPDLGLQIFNSAFTN